MVLKSYFNAARSRVTWRNRHVNQDEVLPKVLGICKNQDMYGEGTCVFVGLCNALEAHLRIKTKSQTRNLSPMDLKEKMVELVKSDQALQKEGLVTQCLHVLLGEGVNFEDPQSQEETCRIGAYQRHHVTIKGDAYRAAHNYLVDGPMVGVFKVLGGDLDGYGMSTGFDVIHFVNDTTNDPMNYLSHLVTVSGYGLEVLCPFWEFQNTYGPQWRGASQGYGQLYALHMIELYGFKLAE